MLKQKSLDKENMFAEFSIFTTKLLNDDIYIKNLDFTITPEMYLHLTALIILTIFATYALSREYHKTKDKTNILYIIIFIIFSASIIFGLLFIARESYKTNNDFHYNEETNSYEKVEINEDYPATWENNKEEIYDKALERFKDNPDDFNLKNACEDYVNDKEKPSACGGDLNVPLETTINGNEATVRVVATTNTINDEKIIIDFKYVFYQ